MRAKRSHFGLRLTSALYRVLALAALLLTFYACFWWVSQFTASRTFQAGGLTKEVNDVFIAVLIFIVVSGLILALTFWMLATMAGVISDIDHKVNIITEYLKRQSNPDASLPRATPPPPAAPQTHGERVARYLDEAEKQGKW